jgi:hypothetical protein
MFQITKLGRYLWCLLFLLDGGMPAASWALTIYRLGGTDLPPPELTRQPDVEFVQIDWAELEPQRYGETQSLEIHPDYIAPSQRQPGVNLVPRIEENGGMVLILGFYGWYGSGFYERFDYGEATPFFDGDPETAWVCDPTQEPSNRLGVPSRQRIIAFDLGETLNLQRIRFYPRAPFEDTRRVPRFIIGVDDGDPAWDGRREYYPEYFSGQGCDVRLLSRATVDQIDYDYDIVFDVGDNRAGIVELEMPASPIRRLLFEAPLKARGAWEIAEFEIYAAGYVARANYTANIIDLGQPSSLGMLSWDGTCDPGAEMRISSRVGDDEDPQVYWRKTFRGDETTRFDRQGQLLTWVTYHRLEGGERAGATYDGSNWTLWSHPTGFSTGQVSLQGDRVRRYVQFKADFRSTEQAGGKLDYVQLAVSQPPVASQVLAEITPSVVPAGETTSFIYKLRPRLQPKDLGFDSIEIDTPVRPEAVEEVRIEGEEVVYQVIDVHEGGFTVRIPRVDVQGTEELIEVLFRTRVFDFGRVFAGRVFDSTRPYEVAQAVTAGDADGLVDSNTLGVALRDAEFHTLHALRLRPTVFTPNGDGINDVAKIEFELLNLARPVPVTIAVYDLSGRKRAEVFRGEKGSGHAVVTWDGREESGLLLPVGLYVVKGEVRTDIGRDRMQRVLSLVY